MENGNGVIEERAAKWRRRLLDFSARNRLLNIPQRARHILRLGCPDISALEDSLAGGEEIACAAADGAAGRGVWLCASGATDARPGYRQLLDLYREARTELEESGTNTLFVAAGVLKWVESTGAAPCLAPILLIPVRIERPTANGTVRIRRRDEDTALNSTLVEFLRLRFGIEVAGLEPMPCDDHGANVPLILHIVREAVRGRPGWEVLEEAYLGCFSFGKFVMWKDMTERAEALLAHPLVRHLASGGGRFDDGVGEAAPDTLFCPLGADSSQLAAVARSGEGKTFVLHGPPGTGKSQTITNIIAHNLAIGRRVLFVSEKKAALDVVKARLDRIGLGPFCLELHSNKTEKSRFYAQMKAALDAADRAQGQEWERVAAEKARCRDALDSYVAALHRVYPNGMSAYDAFARVVSAVERPDAGIIGRRTLSDSREDVAAAREGVVALANDFRAASEDALSAFPELAQSTWSPEFERMLLRAAEGVCGLSTPQPFNFAATRLRTLLELYRIRARRAELGRALAAYRLGKLCGVDFDALGRGVEECENSFFVLRFFRRRAILRRFAPFVAPGAGRLDFATFAVDLPKMGEYCALGRRFLELSGFVPDGDFPAPEGRDADAKAFLSSFAEFERVFAEFLGVVCEGSLAEETRPLAEVAEGMVESIGELRNVMRYRKSLAAATGLGVGAFAEYIRRNDDGSLDAAAAFDEAYAAKMVEELISAEPRLGEFNGLAHEGVVARFRQLERRYTALTADVVYARLAARLPRRRATQCDGGTELGMLRRECEKKTRQRAVRQMLADAPTLMPTLKPCFLMSPLSVAQYLGVDYAPFDLVVFDEASQIPVWDAVGVIARAKQLIVVGDPRQMPPTNFFTRGEADADEEADDEVADQESILDECLVAGVDSTRLDWHYRSRHESLIAFSNMHYYDGRLCTFPAASDAPSLGVKFHFVEGGRFEREGRTARTNPTEAAALVDYLCAEVKKPDYRRRSVGIVTFGIPQQRLIRNMLDERRAADPELERLLPEDGDGAYFVKNLENVQGDESDVILFSIGFAPDGEGRFPMNFGPLNRLGGERRLNVAVTRAREQIVVFSSIHAAQIDAGEDGRTKSVGASHLKAFLDYAERGGRLEGGFGGGEGKDAFANTVAKFLESKGYSVERGVGTSKHRIDIGVLAGGGERRYIAGVECDGAAYGSQRTAEDRDVNRAGVLAGLGWKIVRVWSVDWALDRARAERHLLDALEGDAQATPQPTELDIPQAEQPAVASRHVQESQAFQPYRPWSTRKICRREFFYEAASRPDIYEMLSAVVEREGPVYEGLMRKRVAKAWGLGRITDKAVRVFELSTPGTFTVTNHAAGRVFWPSGVSPEKSDAFRVPGRSEESRRGIDEIPPHEIAAAMRYVTRELGRCTQDALYREVLKLFGIPSLTQRSRTFLDEAFAMV